ncbi:UNVERIFIED_CONTAM: hypothetical protein H355_013446 [Colinus virginianus]|nr:hypothetical protein H355_013446 [Colinus virginianus]
MATAAAPDLENVTTVELLEELKRRYACLAKPEGRYIFIGAPGSGKGTQSLHLRRSHCLCHLSTGDMLREAVAQGTEIGNLVRHADMEKGPSLHLESWLSMVQMPTARPEKRIERVRTAKAKMDAGELVSDDIMLSLIGEKVRSPRCRRGFILDGYPRNPSQAQSVSILPDETFLRFTFFYCFLSALHRSHDSSAVLAFAGNPLLLFMLCLTIGREWRVAQVTGEPLVHRKDDNEAVLKKRLDVFKKETMPVIEHYKRQGLLHTLNAAQDSETVSKEMYEFVGKHHKRFFS